MNMYYVKILEEYLHKYKDCDCAIAGKNGPYNMSETPVRNTAHWIMNFTYAYKSTGNQEYKKIVAHFSEYLIRETDKSRNGVLRSMTKDNNVSTHGLICLAWVIEALVEAYSILYNKKLLQTAVKIYFSQPYDWKLHIWKIIDVDGNNYGVDTAFNHSLWFCMAGAKLCQVYEEKEIRIETLDYLEHISKHWSVYRNGLIIHFDRNCDNFILNCKYRAISFLTEITRRGVPWQERNQINYERGYHLFNMYAFAILYKIYPELQLWKSKKFSKAKEYALNINNFICFESENQYAYGYNSPSYEYPLVEYVFGEGETRAEYILFEKFKEYNLDKEDEMKDSVPDKETINARIYEVLQYYKLREQ